MTTPESRINPASRILNALHTVMWLWCFAAPALADSATQPSTRPADASPIDAVLRYNAAMRAGDRQGVIDSYFTTTPTEKKQVGLIADSEVYIGKLLVESQKRFGNEGMKAVGKAIGDLGDDEARAGIVKTEGDSASITFGESAPPLLLRRIDGVWKYDFGKWFGGGTPEQTRLVLEDVMKAGNLAKVLSQDVAIGHFKSVQELADQIERERNRQRGITTKPD